MQVRITFCQHLVAHKISNSKQFTSEYFGQELILRWKVVLVRVVLK